MAKPKENEVPTNIIENAPVLPTDPPAPTQNKSEAPVINLDLKPFADSLTAGFNSLADKMGDLLKPEPIAPTNPPTTQPPAPTPEPKKQNNSRIFDELDPTSWFQTTEAK